MSTKRQRAIGQITITSIIIMSGTITLTQGALFKTVIIYAFMITVR